MKAKSSYILFALLGVMLIGLNSCRFRNDEWVDFSDLSSAKSDLFQVISINETDLSDGIPDNCYLPDGTPVNQYTEEIDLTTSDELAGPRKTNSVTAINIVQTLLKYGNQNKVIEIVGSYPSSDSRWRDIRLSGKIILPKGQRPKRLILVSHYTVGSDAEAPSNCFSLEGLLVKQGYGLILPDYIGYGITRDSIHPYLVMDLTAQNVVDMYNAARPWLDSCGLQPEYEDVILLGYSQGGANTMAVQQYIEQWYADEISIHRVFAGGGPYDVKATYERFVTTDTIGYPVAVPLVLQGMIKGNHLDMKMEDMMQPWLCEKMDDWINSKRYATGQINQFINTKVTHEVLTAEAMNQKSEKVAELYKAMTENSIISYDWEPKAPVYMMHSIDDETVPYTNATNAKSKWKNANITFNFGHYGGHVKTCVQFILTVQTLLQQEEEERKIYE